MATYVLGGYAASDFLVEGGGAPTIGSRFMLDPSFVASTDKLTITVTDDDSTFNGAAGYAIDATQTATVKSAAGATLYSGSVRLGYASTLTNPEGGTITVYQVLVNGSLAGYVANDQLEPGVNYQITNWTDTTSGQPLYSAIATPQQDPALVESIQGGAYNDSILAGGGDDAVSGGAGDDNLYGGAGDDVFWVSDDHNYDAIDGGTDWDVIYAGNYISTAGIVVTFSGTGSGNYDYVGPGNAYGVFNSIEAFGGTEYGDTLNASADAGGVDLYGGGGNDSVTGGSGDDWLVGGAGNDTLIGGEGWDELYGGAGADYMSGGAGGDIFWIDELSGNGDTILGGETGYDYDILGFITTAGGPGVSVTFSGSEAGSYSFGNGTQGTFSQIEAVYGTDAADTKNASAMGSGVTMAGGGGDDLLIGGAGNDLVNGDEGNDTITGGTGNDTISTGAGADVLVFARGSGDDVITDFDMTLSGGLTRDQFDVSGLVDAAGGPVNAWQVDVAEDGAGNAVLYFPGGETVTLRGISRAAVASVPALHSMGIPCYAEGTLIDTPDGLRPIEWLRRGDLVETLDEGAQPIFWTARREPSPGDLRRRAALRPIEIRAGALGNDRPLRVSTQHALWVPEGPAGALARAGHLAQADGRFARHMLGCQRVVWHHLLLPRHALIRAEGTWAESLWPGPMAMAALSAADRLALLALMPQLAPGLLGLATVEATYGPKARPMLPRRAVSAAAVSRWSQRRCGASLLAG
ncbi:MAG: Hint domain-containing protein [Rhodobacteraceae bacterium]|nr:Hint domain-containing protein [Paracoccaceae bacterium]